MLKKLEILGVGITDASMRQILEYVFSSLKNNSKKGYIVTPNPEIIVYARGHSKYRSILNEADLALCDGVGLYLASILLQKHLHSRVTGVDLMEELCKESVRNAVTVGFLGGGHGIALKASKCLSEKYPGLRVAFASEEWPQGVTNGHLFMVNGTEKKKFINTHTNIRDQVSQIDILFVAFGFPKQEEFIAENLTHLPVQMAMGVGGAFDYFAGGVLRAPYVVRSLGVEWLFRLVMQPWRLRRQFSLLTFIWLVLREKFHV